MNRLAPHVFLVLMTLASPLLADTTMRWQQLAPGMDLAVLVARSPSVVGDSRITVLRIDPTRWKLEFAGASQAGSGSAGTAREWCERRQFNAAINAGMFGTDHKTHIGYLRFGEHVNSSGTNAYESVAAFDPRGEKGLPGFRIFDLDSPGVTMASILRDYASAVQNLRLIKRPGLNRWSQQDKRWSEAALGEDSAGRILFIFSRSPFSMHDLNRELLDSGIQIVAAQHLEGGPEAQLFVKVGSLELEISGSFGTSFREDDKNSEPWRIPNVLGVRPRSTVARGTE